MAREDQVPIGSGFNMRTTASDVLAGVDMSGRRVVFTGGYSGVGLEGVKALAAAGASVIVPARNLAKAEDALRDVHGDVHLAMMDLGDLHSVRQFAGDLVAAGEPVHALINNAGIMATPEFRLGNGWEGQFATNHLGHFALTQELLPLLRKAGGARVVSLSSTAHIRGGIRWDDIHFRRDPYHKWDAYAQAKTANSLFAVGLDAREKDNGIRAFAVHPGGIFTPLQRHLPIDEMVEMGWMNPDGTISEQAKPLFKSPEEGGATAVWAATDPRLDGKGGVYCEDCDIAKPGTEDSQRWHHVRDHAVDPEGAQKLWQVTEEMLSEA